MARKSSAVKALTSRIPSSTTPSTGHVLYSVTYEVNEYSIDQAAGFLGGQKSKNVVL